MPTKAELEVKIERLLNQISELEDDLDSLQDENEELENELSQLRPTNDPPQMMRSWEVEMCQKAQAGKGAG